MRPTLCKDGKKRLTIHIPIRVDHNRILDCIAREFDQQVYNDYFKLQRDLDKLSRACVLKLLRIYLVREMQENPSYLYLTPSALILVQHRVVDLFPEID